MRPQIYPNMGGYMGLGKSLYELLEPDQTFYEKTRKDSLKEIAHHQTDLNEKQEQLSNYRKRLDQEQTKLSEYQSFLEPGDEDLLECQRKVDMYKACIIFGEPEITNISNKMEGARRIAETCSTKLQRISYLQRRQKEKQEEKKKGGKN